MNSLSHLLKPKSVAVVGASTRAMRAGNIVMKNLLQGGFEGAIMPVTPRYSSVCGVLAYKDIASLPITPDVAILCTCLLYTSPSPRDVGISRMPSSA